jgi:basic membrane protein A and related proteins
MKKLWKFAAVVATTALIASACGDDDGGSSNDTTPAGGDSVPAADIKVAVVYIGVPDDKGWTYQHEEGIKQLEDALDVEVKRVENVPEGPASEEAMAQLARDGYDLIFATSFGYGNPMNKVALANPDKCFQWATGAKFLIELDGQEVAPNLGTYFGSAEEARYLSGIAAGAASPTGKLGYVAAFPIPEVIRGINAFTLGAQSVNPDATVQVSWTETWFDPAKEKVAAESLLKAGADVLGMHQDTTATGLAADAAGAKWVGYNSDMSESAPDAWLTGPVWDWGPYYVETAQKWAAGECRTDEFYGTMATGMVTLGSFGESVSQDIQDQISAKAEEFASESAVPFTGPIMKQDGSEAVPAGSALDHKVIDGDNLFALLGMDYFVKGVIGKPAL